MGGGKAIELAFASNALTCAGRMLTSAFSIVGWRDWSGIWDALRDPGILAHRSIVSRLCEWQAPGVRGGIFIRCTRIRRSSGWKEKFVSATILERTDDQGWRPAQRMSWA
jgi:hypothetical protein